MRRSIVKPILAGIFIGAALFFMPFFLLRVLIVFLIVGALFRLFGGRRFRGRYSHVNPAFADKIRGMSEEEYNLYKQTFESYGSKNTDQQPSTENK